MSNTQKKNTFFGGAAILTVGVILVKLIGALYKIPLVNILGDSAYGDFNAAYNIYNLFLTISTAGLPVALSKTISEANALDRQNQVQRIFKVAFLTFLALGLVSFLCMSVFAKPLTPLIVGNEKAVLCVMALSPSVLCVCVMSAFRGYAQGHANMVPTTISQIIEAVFKLVMGLGLAIFMISLGLGQNAAAAGAILGVSIGSIFALIYLVVQHLRARRAPMRRPNDVADSDSRIFTHLLQLAIPITLGSAAVAIVTLIDTKLVMFQLKDIFAGIQAGTLTGDSAIFTKAVEIFDGMSRAALKDPTVDVVLDSARKLYGTYSSTMTVYNLPSALMVPLTASVIPAVSACRARHDRMGASKISESALRVGALLCLPMGVGLFALGGPIVQLLFHNLDVALAGPLLATLGLASIFVCIMLICNSILQANGMVYLPILTVVVGGVVKLIVNWFLVGNTNFMIFGAPVGTLCCFAIVAVMELVIIHRTIPAPPRYGKAFLKPLIAAVLMGLSAWGTYGLLTKLLHLGNTLATMGAILVGMAVYFVLVLALQVISKEDLELMPKGDKIARILHIG
ncbi:MAG: polysaccharide biosynthesis protein [Pseudoflavonifractor sp.]